MTNLTEFGKLTRKLRIDHSERLLDMAKKLNVSSSFLSAVEMGHKSPPSNIEEQIIQAYGLTIGEAENLRIAAYRSRDAFTLKPVREAERDTVGLLARRMNSLSETDLASIRRILKGAEGT